MSTHRYAVLGLGLFGSTVAKTLCEQEKEVIAIDIDMDKVEDIMDEVDYALQADFTRYDSLLEAGVNDCETVIIATSSKLEDTILAILHLKKFGTSRIIVKTKNLAYEEVLLKVGADEVIFPEVEMGRRIANELANATVLDLIKIDDRYNIVEFNALKRWVGKTIRDIDFRRQYGVNIIALKSGELAEITVEISPTHIIHADDLFVALTEEKFEDDLFDH